MIVAGWSFTSACNLRCIHCYNASGKPKENELTLEEAYKVADKLKKAGVIAVNFGGGECALRKDFIQLCKYLFESGIEISYTTNGTCFEIIKNHLPLFHDIGVSLDFADEKKHDEFRGVKGNYKKAIHTIKQLVCKGVNTEIVTCITKLNCSENELKKLHELAKKLKVDYWRLNRFRNNGRGADNKSYLALDKEELRKAYAFLAKQIDNSVSTPEPLLRSAFGGNYSFPGDPSGFTAFRIQPDGEVSPSVFLKESGGNIKCKSVKEIMNSDVFKRIRNRKPRGKCRKCSSYYHCRGGDAGASHLEYGHFDGPDPLCWLEPDESRIHPKKKISEKWNVHERYLCTAYVPIIKEYEKKKDIGMKIKEMM
ncbi:MAG: radical SAM protein [Nanoarchaeota archaeon]|nr:radical SAM protein [Nanoarchaeota archaeon]MBU1320829.1 radical SAM protein [Nanoarchaeota archaeon]MBU1596839.1 radical SAM protein [Nanoarchaeota archaeon]MBU2440907.1 radical SAM protein [Nanoarchaeota archaeon]